MILHRYGGSLNDFKDSQDYHKCSEQNAVVSEKENESLDLFVGFLGHLKGRFVPMESKPFLSSERVTVTLDGSEGDPVFTRAPSSVGRSVPQKFRAPNAHWNPNNPVRHDKYYKFEENRRFLLFSYRYFHVMWKYYFTSKQAYAKSLGVSVRELKRRYPGRVNRDLQGLVVDRVYIPFEEMDPDMPRLYSMKKVHRSFPTGFSIPDKEQSYFNFLVNSSAASMIDDVDFRSKKTLDSIRKGRFPPRHEERTSPVIGTDMGSLLSDYLQGMANRYEDTVLNRFFADTMF